MVQRATRRTLLTGSMALIASACGGDDEPTSETPEAAATDTVQPVSTQPPIGSPVAGYGDPERWTGRTLNIAGYGGDIEEAQAIAFFEPFQEATGVDLQINTADPERLIEQVDTEEVNWDVLTLPAERALELARAGYLEAIDFTVVDQTALVSEIVQQYSVGAAFYSTVIAYRADRENPPAGWADFWSVPDPVQPEEPIPPEHLRALRRSPVGTLEFALLADGVPIDGLYPLDIERSFASLDRIRSNVVVWYEDGKQPIELLLAEQVGMASAWNTRAWQLGVMTEIETQWQGGMLTADMWVVPRGAPNADVAMDFINFATRALPSANFARLVPFGPVNQSAFELLDEERLTVMPNSPQNRTEQFIQNWAWWADNGEAVAQRFEDWLLTEPEASPES